jgi:ferredoxin
MKRHTITFPETDHAPAMLPYGANLSENLTIVNSPMLFGCRSGICGTCLIRVERGYEHLIPPGEEEREALEIYAPDNHEARLACQVSLIADISLIKIESE